MLAKRELSLFVYDAAPLEELTLGCMLDGYVQHTIMPE